MKAVIVAAGMGSRLWGKSNEMPKTLMPFGEQTILSTIINNLNLAGIGEFAIVVGYRSQEISEYLQQNDYFGLDIRIVENSEWQKGNGISVLAAAIETGTETFILSMSDHVVSVNALKSMVRDPRSTNLLLVDPRIDRIFDIDDATKAWVDDQRRISQIGKTIADYNAVDCGIFRLTPEFYTAMREQLSLGKESISAAVEGLIKRNRIEALAIGEDDYWIDIDTPEAYQHALGIF